jgi:hypothetical protein
MRSKRNEYTCPPNWKFGPLYPDEIALQPAIKRWGAAYSAGILPIGKILPLLLRLLYSLGFDAKFYKQKVVMSSPLTACPSWIRRSRFVGLRWAKPVRIGPVCQCERIGELRIARAPNSLIRRLLFIVQLTNPSAVGSPF